MRYAVLLEKDRDSDWGVTVPDLPGCFSAGATLDEALEEAREAILLHLEGLIEDGQAIPEPGTIERLKDSVPTTTGSSWAWVKVDPSLLSGKARRVNITVPESLLGKMDDYALRHGGTRSGFIAEAALAYLSREGWKG